MIGPVSNSTVTSPAATQSKVAGLDSNAFLQLLVAQLKQQDPTNPTDSSQFLTQLSSLSQVEQATQANQKLEQLMSTSSATQIASLIGHRVSSVDGSISGQVVGGSLVNEKTSLTLDNGAILDVANGVRIDA